MALGAFRFSLSTAAYQSFRHRVEHRWVRNDVVGGPPRHQYLGSGEQTIILQGVIYPHHKGGLHQMALMQAQAALGVPLYMVDGTGRVWGQWVINEVEEIRRVFEADGVPRRIDFTIKLLRYNEGIVSTLRRAFSS